MTKKTSKAKLKIAAKEAKKLQAVKKNPKNASKTKKNVEAKKETRPGQQLRREKRKFHNWKKRVAHSKKVARVALSKKVAPLDGNENLIANKENDENLIANKENVEKIITEVPSPESLVNKNNLLAAVTGLRKLLTCKTGVKKDGFKDLLQEEKDDAHVFLQIICLKLPRPNEEGKVRPITIKVPFPHSIVDESTEVILITPDIEKGLNVDHENTLHKYKDLLLEHGAVGFVNEIISLRQLKVEYKEYEAKRNLANRVDIVLCDASVIRLVPMFLGKHFYSKNKHPIQVDLKVKDVSTEIQQALSQGQLHLSSLGNSSNIKVGRLGMTDEEVSANILSVVSKLCQHFPGGWENIQRLSIKTTTSKAIPVYANYTSLNSIGEPVIPALPKREDAEGTINVLHDLKVRVTAEGDVQICDKRLKKGLKSKTAKKYKPKISQTGLYIEQEDNLSDVDDDELKDKKKKKKPGKMTKTKTAFMEKLKEKRRHEFAAKTGKPISYPKNFKGPKAAIKKSKVITEKSARNKKNKVGNKANKKVAAKRIAKKI